MHIFIIEYWNFKSVLLQFYRGVSRQEICTCLQQGIKMHVCVNVWVPVPVYGEQRPALALLPRGLSTLLYGIGGFPV